MSRGSGVHRAFGQTVLNLVAQAFVPARTGQGRGRPGSAGEHTLQERFGTTQRAQQFYRHQVAGQLTPVMQEFIARMEMAFIATSDSGGECDCSFRAGPAGFIRVLDDHTIAYPEYRGNGVMASLGNMLQNPHIGIFLADFTRDLIGLHVNGDADIVSPARMQELDLDLPGSEHPGRRPVQWVLVTVTEAYIHCSKHIPKLIPQSRVRHWGTDSPRHKGGDYFGVTSGQATAGQPAYAMALSADMTDTGGDDSHRGHVGAGTRSTAGGAGGIRRRSTARARAAGSDRGGGRGR